jgi:hypothetical protein
MIRKSGYRFSEKIMLNVNGAKAQLAPCAERIIDYGSARSLSAT